MNYFLNDSFRKLWPESPSYYFTYDDNGIVLINYPDTNRMASGIKERYHPTVIAAYALSEYNKGRGFTDTFLKYANRLVDNDWAFDFVWKAPNYKCDPPWISSMTQGMGISVLVRAYELTKDSKYLRATEKALTCFEVPIAKGGLLRIIDGYTWYEGTPSPIGLQILNEALFALIGLYELSTYNGRAEELFEHGIITIKRHLADFDLNLWLFKWSKYDNKRLSYSGDKYHDVHIQQLKWLANKINDRRLLETALKWESQQKNTNRYIKFVFKIIWSKVYKRYLAR